MNRGTEHSRGIAGLRGFTLIELLFSFLIMSVMTVLLYNALFTAIKGVKVVDRVFVTPRKALILSKIFERELTGIYLPEIVQPAIKKDQKGKKIAVKKTIKEKMVFGLYGKAREIHFTTLLPVEDSEQPATDDKDAPPIGDIIEIGYEFDRGDKTLTKRRDPIPDEKITKGGEEQEYENIRLAEVKFEYFDKKWESSWDSAKKKKLPRAVKATFEILVGEKLEEELSDEELKALSIRHEVVVLLPNAVDNKKI